MEATNKEVRIKYIISFNGGNFWTEQNLTIAERDRDTLQALHKNVAISELIEYIDNGKVIETKERRLQ